MPGTTWRIDWTSASFSSPESTAQTVKWSVQPFLHSSQQKVPILYNGRPFPLKLSLLMGRSEPQSNSWFLGPVRVHNQNTITIGSAVLHRWPLSIPTTGCPFSPQNCPFPWAIWTPNLIHGFLGPSKSSTQIASRSVQSFLQGSQVWQTDRPSDRPRYSVGNNRPHLHK